jgi:hypothetical protein
VFFSNKDKPRERFYLLPGQGGKNYRRKQRVILGWTVAVALLSGGILAAVMYIMSKPQH